MIPIIFFNSFRLDLILLLHSFVDNPPWDMSHVYVVVILPTYAI